MAATTKQQVVHEFRMQSIRDAASRVVTEHGVAGATIDAIAAEAGIAKGTIYLYFKSREELLEHAADHAVAELLTQVEGVLRAREPFDSQLRGFIRTVIYYFDEHQNFFRLYQTACREDERRSRHYTNYIGNIRNWIKDAMEGGEARRLDVERVTLVLTESLSAVIRRRQSETPPPVDADAEWLASLFLDGLMPPVKGNI